jgi:hypothetical protein
MLKPQSETEAARDGSLPEPLHLVADETCANLPARREGQEHRCRQVDYNEWVICLSWADPIVARVWKPCGNLTLSTG